MSLSGALDNTTSWIKGTLEELQSTIVTSEQTKSQGKVVPGPFQVLNTALLGILTWDYGKGPLPEVRVRLNKIMIQRKTHLITISNVISHKKVGTIEC